MKASVSKTGVSSNRDQRFESSPLRQVPVAQRIRALASGAKGREFESLLGYQNMPKFEESAGGIVYKKEKDQTFVLVTQHSAHHGWVFPKGLIDNGESKELTALREVKEEGGVEAKIIKELSPVEYFYKLEGQTIKKKVTYFLMEYISGDIQDHDWEMEAADWLELDKVEDRLTYKTDKQVFQKAQKLLLS